eukprot:TRINITY_DN23001_c0_g2_i1.p1 TRINITY_DN23001_c0_g2~~TRINITY_DN23001_c0_g2_i1.p1  ORF type:complete len:424 (+),score=62.34 TRINITY_DN23001_c0_g2_i1:79-1350(+)
MGATSEYIAMGATPEDWLPSCLIEDDVRGLVESQPWKLTLDHTAGPAVPYAYLSWLLWPLIFALAYGGSEWAEQPRLILHNQGGDGLLASYDANILPQLLIPLFLGWLYIQWKGMGFLSISYVQWVGPFKLFGRPVPFTIWLLVMFASNVLCLTSLALNALLAAKVYASAWETSYAVSEGAITQLLEVQQRYVCAWLFASLVHAAVPLLMGVPVAWFWGSISYGLCSMPKGYRVLACTTMRHRDVVDIFATYCRLPALGDQRTYMEIRQADYLAEKRKWPQYLQRIKDRLQTVVIHFIMIGFLEGSLRLMVQLQILRLDSGYRQGGVDWQVAGPMVLTALCNLQLLCSSLWQVKLLRRAVERHRVKVPSASQEEQALRSSIQNLLSAFLGGVLVMAAVFAYVSSNLYSCLFLGHQCSVYWSHN